MTRARDVANLIGSGNFSSTTFTATAGQTAFSISHTQGFVQVFMNGLLLDETVDYTSNGSAITLTSGAAAGDEIEVVKYNTFSVGDAIPASGGTFTGNVSMSGTLGVTGAVTASNGLTVDDDGATVLTVDRATSDGTIIDLQKDGTSVGKLGIQTSGFYIDGESGHEGIRFGNGSVNPRENGADSDGTSSLGTSSARWSNLYLTGGAYIGGTGSANHLDDYEEGTWTPTTSGSSEWAIAHNRSCTYTKIGRLVHITANLSIYRSGSGSVQIEIGGLPFTPLTYNTGRANATPWIDYINTGVVGTIVAGVWDSNPKIRHYIVRTNSTVNQSNVSSNHLSSSVNSEYQINIQYLA